MVTRRRDAHIDHDAGPTAAASQRIDQWLWHARLFKSRTLAAAACQSRHMRVDGRPVVKCSVPVRSGSVISFPRQGQVCIVRVRALAQQRRPYAEARLLYEDLSPGGDGHAPTIRVAAYTDSGCSTQPLDSAAEPRWIY